MPKVKRRDRAHRSIPNHLSEGRYALGMTQLEVAGDLGVTRGTYSTWESGLTLPSPAHGGKLQELLGRGIYEDWVWDFMERLDGAAD